MNIPGRASWATALSGLPLRVSFEAWFSCIHDVWQGIESYWPYIITFMGTTSLKVIMQDSKEDMYIHRTHNQEYVAYETKLTAWLTHMYCTVKNVTDSVWPCMWSYSDHTIHVITLYDHMQLVMTWQLWKSKRKNAEAIKTFCRKRGSLCQQAPKRQQCAFVSSLYVRLRRQ